MRPVEEVLFHSEQAPPYWRQLVEEDTLLDSAALVEASRLVVVALAVAVAFAVVVAASLQVAERQKTAEVGPWWIARMNDRCENFRVLLVLLLEGVPSS